MSAQSLVGQSLSSKSTQISVFGGFDDRFMIVDWLTGRVTETTTTGRTIVLPWDADRFVSVAGVLGRESKVEIELRAYVEPATALDRLVAGDLPAKLDPAWGDRTRVVPAVFPVVYQLGGGIAAQRDLVVGSAAEVTAAPTFVPGVFNDSVGVADDERGFLVGTSGVTAPLEVPLRLAVGHGNSIWAVDDATLWVIRDGVAKASAIPPQRPPPAFIEYDVSSDAVLIGFWRRWPAWGGPATDVQVFDGEGKPLASGSFDRLTQRATLQGTNLLTVDTAGIAAGTALRPRQR